MPKSLNGNYYNIIISNTSTYIAYILTALSCVVLSNIDTA